MSRLRYSNLPEKDFSKNTQESASSKTKRFFNGYFESDIPIDTEEWNIVVDFFVSKTGSEENAKALAEAIITSAYENGIRVLDIIEDLKDFDGLELDEALALYFNRTRRNTSLLGISQNRTPNKYISRNILA